ncbi:MAG: LuxR C-terminal-related transcriptional regulator [Steroidobacteraceae bacterium]
MADAFSALSLREREVLALIADGLSNARTAEQLQIGDKTVRNQASNLVRQARRALARRSDRVRARARIQAPVRYYSRDAGERVSICEGGPGCQRRRNPIRVLGAAFCQHPSGG